MIAPSTNRMTMHSPFYNYKTSGQALEMNFSPALMSLNGIWEYVSYDSCGSVPGTWMQYPGQENTGRIPVPSCQENHGIGKAVYTNIIYPFDRETGDHSFEREVVAGSYELAAPAVPLANRNVCYYRIFKNEDSWKGMRVYLRFGGVETAMDVAINGNIVGHSEDSKLDAEFDITEYVREGENLLAVRVYEFSPESYLEDQDYWHVHGIYRDVALEIRNPFHMKDFQVQTLFGESMKDASLRIRIWPDERTPLFGETRAAVFLYDQEQNLVLRRELEQFSTWRGYLSNDFVADVTIPVTDPMLWTDETPYLYTLIIEITDGQGNPVAAESCRIGFREVRIRNGVLQLNRKRLILRGVNLHEWSAEGMRVVSEEELRRQLFEMKRLNFNAIRTCHYPKNNMFYDMCDQLGFYVVDEANLETHGYGGRLSDSAEWLGSYMDRAVRMALRDKNHASVIIWSLGNESGPGANFAAMYGWLKSYDNRPVQYESGGSLPEMSDIVCPMYADKGWIEECMSSDDHRPFIMCEYAYAKSNSNGALDMYWDMIRKYERFQGGFVWDFHDKAVCEVRQGKRLFRYAGALGETVRDHVPDMCLNGVVFADYSWKPAAYELRNLQSPIRVIYQDWHGMFGDYYIINENITRDLSEYNFEWELLCDGELAERGTLEDVHAYPGERIPLRIPYDTGKVHGETMIRLIVKTRYDSPWADSGMTVYQWERQADGSMFWSDQTDVMDDAGENLVVTENEDDIHIDGGSLHLTFSRRTGSFTEEKDSFYRAPTGIDEGQGDNCYYNDWLELGLDHMNEKVEYIFCSGSGAIVHLKASLSYLNGKILVTRDYEITEKAVSVTVNVSNRTGLETLPRIGLSLKLPVEMRYLKWYGRGPWENYADRKQSALLGVYNSTTEEMHEDYVRCCECGGREDTRWLTLTDEQGRGIRVSGAAPFHFSALPWSVNDYANAEYADQLPVSENTFLNLDGYHAGVGGDTGWTKNIHSEYRIPDGGYLFRFFIRRL